MKYLLQHGGDEIQPLVDAVAPVNRAYAERHGFEYRVFTLSVFPKDLGADGKYRRDAYGPYWEKIRILTEFLPTVAEGAFVAWLDMDAIITALSVDLLQAMDLPFQNEAGQPYDIGMVPLPHGPLNAGVIFVRNSAKIQDFFHACLMNGPVVDDVWNKRGWNGWEERRLTVELEKNKDVKLQELHWIWNSFHPTQEEVIFHAGDRPLADKIHLIEMVKGLPAR